MKNSEMKMLRDYRIARVQARNLLQHDISSLKHRTQPKQLAGEALIAIRSRAKSSSENAARWSKNNPWPLIGLAGGIIGLLFRKKIRRVIALYAVKSKLKYVRRTAVHWLGKKGKNL